MAVKEWAAEADEAWAVGVDEAWAVGAVRAWAVADVRLDLEASAYVPNAERWCRTSRACPALT